MVEWGLIGLSVVGAYKGVKGKAPALRDTFSKAKISELFRLSKGDVSGAKIGLNWEGAICEKRVTAWLLRITLQHCRNFLTYGYQKTLRLLISGMLIQVEQSVPKR
jgi:hypothetical protein